MKPYHFPLQAVQILRQRQEQVALEKYAAAIRVRRLAEDQFELVKEELEAVWAALQQSISQNVTAAEMKQVQQYCQSVEERSEQCAAALETAEAGVTLAWQILVEARRHRELIDKYDESLRRRYQRELQRQEQALADEAANRPAIATTIWKPSQQPLNN
jgi:flagellar export protein FliJ